MQQFHPHPYQQAGIEAILEKPGVALWMEMGLGKTVVTLTAIDQLIYDRLEISRALIIAPKKVAEATWQDEAEKWEHLQHLRISTVLGTEKQRKAALEAPADIYIINRENVPWLVHTLGRGWNFDMVVLDEASSFKNRADHDDFLKRLKINNYQSMSDSQLRKALVGKTWTNDCLESTAYDSRDNPFWPQPGGRRSTGKHGQGGSVSGNREVLIRYHTAKSTRAAFIQPSQSEAVLAVGTHHKITGVRSTRTGPSHTLGSGKRVIELEIEVW